MLYLQSLIKDACTIIYSVVDALFQILYNWQLCMLNHT